MTDDDRMDRAERIRKMREGDRETDTDEQPSADSEEPSDGTTTESEADSATAAQSASTAGGEPTTDAQPATETTDPEEWFEDEPAAQQGQPSGSSGGDQQSAADAASAAQRAAQSAQQFGGGGQLPGDGATTGGQLPGDRAATGGQQPAESTPTGPTGFELPDQQLLDEAMDSATTATTEGGARAAAVGQESTGAEELVRVLEFSLSGEHYCLDIEYVEEIVKRDTITRVPNTPDYVEGVVDLRGQITTILDPTAMMDVDSAGSQDLIVVFDPEMSEDQGAIGWVVDEVRQVAPVTEDQVNDPPVDAEYINGVVDREETEQFVIWIEPDDALEQATLEDGE